MNFLNTKIAEKYQYNFTMCVKKIKGSNEVFFKELRKIGGQFGKIEAIRTRKSREAIYESPGSQFSFDPKIAFGDDFQFYKHQANAIDAITNGNDVIITTGTGSGKTLAFLLPIINSLQNTIKEINI